MGDIGPMEWNRVGSWWTRTKFVNRFPAFYMVFVCVDRDSDDHTEQPLPQEPRSLPVAPFK